MMMNAILKMLWLGMLVGPAFTERSKDITRFYKVFRGYGFQCNFSGKNDPVDVSNMALLRYNAMQGNKHVYSLDAPQQLLGHCSFHVDVPFILYIPDFGDSFQSAVSKLMRDTYKKIYHPQFFILDCSSYVDIYDDVKASFERAVYNSYHIGNKMALYLAQLIYGGVPSTNIHIIGYGLGAQIAGYTGRILQASYNVKIWRITALDAAGRCFDVASLRDIVSREDATLVDMIITNPGEIGSKLSIGTVNIYANGDDPKQALCIDADDPSLAQDAQAALCSHVASVLYWTNSVSDFDAYQAIRCSSWDNLKHCKDNPKTYLGHFIDKNAIGKYYFSGTCATDFIDDI